MLKVLVLLVVGSGVAGAETPDFTRNLETRWKQLDISSRLVSMFVIIWCSASHETASI